MSFSKVYRDSKVGTVQATATYDQTKHITTIQVIDTWSAIVTAGSDWTVENAYTALTASDGVHGIPQPGTSGYGGIVTQVQPTLSPASPFHWRVQVTYSSVTPGAVTGSGNWNVDIKLTNSKTDQEAALDRNGTPIVNYAGQPYSPSVPETLYESRLDISYDTFTPPDYDDKLGYVNSDSLSFTVAGLEKAYDPRTLLFDNSGLSIGIPVTTAPTDPVWHIELTWLYRKDTWDPNIKEVGFSAIPPGGTLGTDPPVINTDPKNGNAPFTEAQALAADGTLLGAHSVPLYRTWEIKPQAAFSSMFTI